MRIVITGSSGLLGRHVAAAAVAAGHDVLGIDTAPPTEGGWRHITADLTDLGVALQLVRNADAVFHIAAIPRPIGRAEAEVFQTNMALAYNVIEAAALSGIGRVVYASSFSIFGYPFFTNWPDQLYLPIDDNHPAGPQDAYGLSKWLGEEMVQAAVRRGAFTAVSLRMPWVQTPEGFAAQIGPRRASGDAGRDLWSYIDARDAADAFLLALEAPVEGHARVMISAADSYMDEPTADLAERHFPKVKRGALPGYASTFDLENARQTLGYEPRHSWREYPAT
ncbi:NAD-dependent epimerase/dehydratase family protein [Kaistia terrae]|uniref:NAD-dependent epimerase/dehydratase family protein n=1 Tax=Kaistia terrae TaxID=537017 RepID=A0ABW0Q054_9HYPH|nr:NAD(P)-dependent oxidoreductase [Kaistia terrae]MCX5580545.1 NAD(P)-dependent oxidoreductase [Kaistia terrae]